VENTVWTSLILLAADERSGGSPFGMWWPLIAIVALFWFLLIVPQQREKKRRQAMLSELKKNDRVITVGGIYGVVTNVHREADEVTIKVDETANVKIRVTRSSVARVLRDESSDDSSSKKT
jgi:preprotein translocase subunit YajC